MTNNLHHPKDGTQIIFLSLGLGYHQIYVVGLEFVQRCGHQIRVNTWTVSIHKSYLNFFKAQKSHLKKKIVKRYHCTPLSWSVVENSYKKETAFFRKLSKFASSTSRVYRFPEAFALVQCILSYLVGLLLCSLERLKQNVH